jgi:hypothetical protein
MAALTVDHKFNDDLLLLEEDRKLASIKYPTIFYVLDHPQLRQLFSKYDAPANRAKRIGLVAGFGAIGFGFSALGVAALELVLSHPTGDSIVLAAISGACGILSFLIGSVGVLFAGRKRNWLCCRLVGERIRQFHFQMIVSRLPEIAASLREDGGKISFISERNVWFESFKAHLVGKVDSTLTAILREENSIDPWLHDSAGAVPAEIQQSKDLNPIFDAYRELRITHQLDYTNYKLQDDYRIISAMPRRQLAVISGAGFALIVLLVVVHVGILAGALFPSSMFAAVHSTDAAVVIIWLALAALAIRAVEQGLQPEREVERYQQYRSGIRAILERYDNAASQNAKVEIMREMERLAFEEMRNFLVTNERSHFVM